MPLNAPTRQLLDSLTAGTPLDQLTPAEAREHVRERAYDGPPQSVARILDRAIPGPAGDIPIRLYYPKGDAPHPATMFFHGGGWVLCDLETHDTVCRRLCRAANCVVAAVDYRRAPEHPFPAAVEDAFAATTWVAAHAAELHIDPARLAVAGDSAGGNLSAVVCLLARDRGAPRLSFQLLIVPVTDVLPDTASYRDNAAGYFLTRSFMQWFFGHYLPPGTDPRDWRVAPLHAPSLANLPPALILTAEFDPLRDEGEAYARRLVAEGVPVTLRRYDGTIHQFFIFSEALPQGQEAMELAAAEMRRVWDQQLHE